MKKNKILIIIIALLILALICLIIFFIKPKSSSLGNLYDVNNEKTELPNTTIYKNDKLLEKHCLNSICIDDVIFYYNDDMGRIEYTITNNSNKVKSGYLKMVFNDLEITIVYKDLEPKKTINSKYQYSGIEIKDKSDYKLRKLTKEELSKFIK